MRTILSARAPSSLVLPATRTRRRASARAQLVRCGRSNCAHAGDEVPKSPTNKGEEIRAQTWRAAETERKWKFRRRKRHGGGGSSGAAARHIRTASAVRKCNCAAPVSAQVIERRRLRCSCAPSKNDVDNELGGNSAPVELARGAIGTRPEWKTRKRKAFGARLRLSGERRARRKATNAAVIVVRASRQLPLLTLVVILSIAHRCWAPQAAAQVQVTAPPRASEWIAGAEQAPVDALHAARGQSTVRWSASLPANHLKEQARKHKVMLEFGGDQQQHQKQRQQGDNDSYDDEDDDDDDDEQHRDEDYVGDVGQAARYAAGARTADEGSSLFASARPKAPPDSSGPNGSQATQDDNDDDYNDYGTYIIYEWPRRTAGAQRNSSGPPDALWPQRTPAAPTRRQEKSGALAAQRDSALTASTDTLQRVFFAARRPQLSGQQRREANERRRSEPAVRALAGGAELVPPSLSRSASLSSPSRAERTSRLKTASGARRETQVARAGPPSVKLTDAHNEATPGLNVPLSSKLTDAGAAPLPAGQDSSDNKSAPVESTERAALSQQKRRAHNGTGTIGRSRRRHEAQRAANDSNADDLEWSNEKMNGSRALASGEQVAKTGGLIGDLFAWVLGAIHGRALPGAPSKLEAHGRLAPETNTASQVKTRRPVPGDALIDGQSMHAVELEGQQTVAPADQDGRQDSTEFIPPGRNSANDNRDQYRRLHNDHDHNEDANTNDNDNDSVNNDDYVGTLAQQHHQLTDLTREVTTAAANYTHASNLAPAAHTNETDATSRVHLWRLVWFVLPLGATFGNLLVIIAVHKERSLQSVTNYFIVSLAFADLFVGLIVMPFAVYVLVNEVWQLGDTLCDIFVAVDVTCSTASILNLVAISIDRYLAIAHPIAYSAGSSGTRAVLTIALVWAISCCVGAPIILGLNTTPERQSTLCILYNSTFILWSSLTSFYVPCIIMLGLYWRIYLAIRSRTKKAIHRVGGANHHGHHHARQRAAGATSATHHRGGNMLLVAANHHHNNGADREPKQQAANEAALAIVQPLQVATVLAPQQLYAPDELARPERTVDQPQRADAHVPPAGVESAKALDGSLQAPLAKGSVSHSDKHKCNALARQRRRSQNDAPFSSTEPSTTNGHSQQLLSSSSGQQQARRLSADQANEVAQCANLSQLLREEHNRVAAALVAAETGRAAKASRQCGPASRRRRQGRHGSATVPALVRKPCVAPDIVACLESVNACSGAHCALVHRARHRLACGASDNGSHSTLGSNSATSASSSASSFGSNSSRSMSPIQNEDDDDECLASSASSTHYDCSVSLATATARRASLSSTRQSCCGGTGGGGCGGQSPVIQCPACERLILSAATCQQLKTGGAEPAIKFQMPDVARESGANAAARVAPTIDEQRDKSGSLPASARGHTPPEQCNATAQACTQAPPNTYDAKRHNDTPADQIDDSTDSLRRVDGSLAASDVPEQSAVTTGSRLLLLSAAQRLKRRSMRLTNALLRRKASQASEALTSEPLGSEPKSGASAARAYWLASNCRLDADSRPARLDAACKGSRSGHAGLGRGASVEVAGRVATTTTSGRAPVVAPASGQHDDIGDVETGSVALRWRASSCTNTEAAGTSTAFTQRATTTTTNTTSSSGDGNESQQQHHQHTAHNQTEGLLLGARGLHAAAVAAKQGDATGASGTVDIIPAEPTKSPLGRQTYLVASMLSLVQADGAARPTNRATATMQQQQGGVAVGQATQRAHQSTVGSPAGAHSPRAGSRRRREKNVARRERKATKTLAIVLGIFLICWTPFFTCNIIDGICIQLELDYRLDTSFTLVTSWLGYINSCVNPIIYTIFNMEFRRAFEKILASARPKCCS